MRINAKQLSRCLYQYNKKKTQKIDFHLLSVLCIHCQPMIKLIYFVYKVLIFLHNGFLKTFQIKHFEQRRNSEMLEKIKEVERKKLNA